MNLSYIYQSTHYGVILETIVGKSFKQIYDIIILVYLFSTTVVMIAGSGAIGEAFQTSYIWGIAFTITCILIVLSFHVEGFLDRKSTRLNSSHVAISYAVFCLK